MVNLCASAYNGYIWQKPEEKFDVDRYREMISLDIFKRYPCFTGEDFYENLCLTGMERKEAFEVAKRIRMGLAIRQPDRLSKYNVPKEILEIAKAYRYVTSRAYCVQTLLN